MTPIARVREVARRRARVVWTLMVTLLLTGCSASAAMEASYAPAPMEEAPGMAAGAAAPAQMQDVTAAKAPAAPASEGAWSGGAEMAGASPLPPAAPGARPRPVGAPVKPAPTAKGPESPAARGAKQGDADAVKASEQAPTIAQMLIYTAQLALQVDQEAFSVTIDRVVDIAVGFGGYIATSDNSSVQVRVPSAGFRDALKQMEKLGLVTNRAVQVQDVSEEFADLEVKLKSLRATRDRLEQFLARAKDIQEVLNVERELSRLNGEIDRIEGRMRFLSSRAAFSTITVSLQPKPKQVIIPKTDEPPPPPPRTIPLPIPWLGAVGIDRLLQLSY